MAVEHGVVLHVEEETPTEFYGKSVQLIFTIK